MSNVSAFAAGIKLPTASAPMQASATDEQVREKAIRSGLSDAAARYALSIRMPGEAAPAGPSYWWDGAGERLVENTAATPAPAGAKLYRADAAGKLVEAAG